MFFFYKTYFVLFFFFLKAIKPNFNCNLIYYYYFVPLLTYHLMRFLPLSSKLSLRRSLKKNSLSAFLLKLSLRLPFETALSPNRMDLPFPLQTQSRSSYSSADLVRKVLFFFFVDYVFQCNIFILFHVKNIAFIWFLLCGSASLLSYFLDFNSKSYPFEAALSPNRMDLPFSLQTQSRSSYSLAKIYCQ